MKRACLALSALLTFAALPAFAQDAAAPVPAPAATPAPVPAVPKPATVKVSLQTSEGNILLELEKDRAPITTKNFLRYVDTKRMDGFSFYRTTRSWGPDSKLVQAGNRGDARKNFPPIAHEPTNVTGLKSCDGALLMARLAPGDATTDFFLLLSNIPGFEADPKAPGDNAGFAVFGHVVSGMDVVRQIFEQPTDPDKGEGWLKGQMLVQPVTITRAHRVAVGG